MFASIIGIKWHTYIEGYLLKSFVLYPPLSCNDFFVRCFRQGSFPYLIHSISFRLATSNMYIFIFEWSHASLYFHLSINSYIYRNGTIELKHVRLGIHVSSYMTLYYMALHYFNNNIQHLRDIMLYVKLFYANEKG